MATRRPPKDHRHLTVITGEFGDAAIIRKFGDVPDVLSSL
jgi:hypothetical protein